MEDGSRLWGFPQSESRKWFAVIMDIDRSKLEEGKTGEVEILNVKLDGLAPGCLEKSGIYMLII